MSKDARMTPAIQINSAHAPVHSCVIPCYSGFGFETRQHENVMFPTRLLGVVVQQLGVDSAPDASVPKLERVSHSTRELEISQLRDRHGTNDHMPSTGTTGTTTWPLGAKPYNDITTYLKYVSWFSFQCIDSRRRHMKCGTRHQHLPSLVPRPIRR